MMIYDHCIVTQYITVLSHLTSPDFPYRSLHTTLNDTILHHTMLHVYYTPLNFKLDKTILHHTTVHYTFTYCTPYTLPYTMHSIVLHYTTLHVPQRCQLSWILHESHEIDIYLTIAQKAVFQCCCPPLL